MLLKLPRLSLLKRLFSSLIRFLLVLPVLLTNQEISLTCIPIRLILLIKVLAFSLVQVVQRNLLQALTKRLVILVVRIRVLTAVKVVIMLLLLLLSLRLVFLIVVLMMLSLILVLLRLESILFRNHLSMMH